MWAPIGAVMVRYGPELLKLSGDWTVQGVNLRFAPSYLLTITGGGIILYGFVLAYRAAAAAAQPETPVLLPPAAKMQRELVGAGV